MGKRFHRFVILAIAAALFAAVVLRLFHQSPRTVHVSKNPETTASVAGVTAALSPSPNEAFATATISSFRASSVKKPAASPGLPPAPDDPTMLELDQVNLMIRDYRTLTGGNPVGTNSEIMAALMGKNPREAKLGPPEGAKLNERGELIDRWGTPYFFHQLSRNHMEIRSAGPDKVMWTEDDPVIH